MGKEEWVDSERSRGMQFFRVIYFIKWQWQLINAMVTTTRQLCEDAKGSLWHPRTGFSVRAREASSADPEQWSWALPLASSTLLLLHPQPGDLDYLRVRQLHVLPLYCGLWELLKAQLLIPAGCLISWPLLISPISSLIL